MLALGFMIGRILHHNNAKITAAAAEDVTVEKMDIDSALNSAISSAVSQLGERFLCTSFTFIFSKYINYTVKWSHTRLRVLGMELIPVYWQSACK